MGEQAAANIWPVLLAMIRIMGDEGLRFQLAGAALSGMIRHEQPT